ncbi:hypothetical protein [Rhizobium sp. RU36D]|uniref:hypothetical protein n=1 Tax=Rhizobium sp. RU36D TaxID=1907415 RepID=UPI0009D80C0B|nr:hypothetical protein [Rhizobium sp. RU36D]SMD18270.1 hypothetical protein SAMN05880593_13455 [Rhizobium sp. RU36D]
MTEPSTQFREAVTRLIESVEFDVNGSSGQGGNGGLISDKTIRAAGELRILLSRTPSPLQPDMSKVTRLVATMIDVLRREISYGDRDRAREKFNELDRFFRKHFLGDADDETSPNTLMPSPIEAEILDAIRPFLGQPITQSLCHEIVQALCRIGNASVPPPTPSSNVGPSE